MLVASRVNLGWVRSSLREGNYRPPQKKISMSRELPALPGIWENECLIFQGIWVRPDSIHHHMEEQRASVLPPRQGLCECRCTEVAWALRNVPRIFESTLKLLSIIISGWGALNSAS